MTKPSALRSASFSLALSLLGALAACGGSADAQQPAASPTAAAPAAAPAAGSFAITAQNSKIEWTGSKTSAHHDGAFTSFTGRVDVPGAIEKGKVVVDIDTASLTVNDPTLGPMADKLMGHLKSPDFFDVAKFAKAGFVSSGITPGGENGAGYTVSGTLTIHGASKAISFPANIAVAGSKLDATATLTINRKDFGLTYPGKPDDPIKDDVQVKLTIHADKQ